MTLTINRSGYALSHMIDDFQQAIQASNPLIVAALSGVVTFVPVS